MSKLFVYGCSFSMGFNDFQRKKDPKYSWPFLLSNYLKHPLVLRSWAGYGWNQIKTFIDNDLLGYVTDYSHPKKGPEFYAEKLTTKDIVIISPSYFDRIRFPELTYDDNKQMHVVAKYGHSIDKMAKIQFVSFKAKVNLLNQAGIRTLGWPWFGYAKDMNDYNRGKRDIIGSFLPTVLRAAERRRYREDRYPSDEPARCGTACSSS